MTHPVIPIGDDQTLAAKLAAAVGARTRDDLDDLDLDDQDDELHDDTLGAALRADITKNTITI